ncbi:classical arabinogalactan protein 26-like [Abrus precatorius]|uniref:Classical arabinogalactan protein 26-like n=1 Tax=Abrus precatorius TaxID=3816 RepID=A0A8B8K394_ABRPR|nr:classical arabinogalactan protein 26-like [Abrus precatorius]
MASYNAYFMIIIMSFMLSPMLSSYSQPIPKVPTLSSSPATLTDPPPSPLSPFQELSPDIAPLLPSPGGVLPTPAGSDIPLIPSNPSPPNPDDIIAPGPLSPFGSIQATSNAPASLVCSIATTAIAGLAAYWSIYAAVYEIYDNIMNPCFFLYWVENNFSKQYHFSFYDSTVDFPVVIIERHFVYSWKPRSDGTEELLPALSGLHVINLGDGTWFKHVSIFSELQLEHVTDT